MQQRRSPKLAFHEILLEYIIFVIYTIDPIDLLKCLFESIYGTLVLAVGLSDLSDHVITKIF